MDPISAGSNSPDKRADQFTTTHWSGVPEAVEVTALGDSTNRLDPSANGASNGFSRVMLTP